MTLGLESRTRGFSVPTEPVLIIRVLVLDVADKGPGDWIPPLKMASGK